MAKKSKFGLAVPPNVILRGSLSPTTGRDYLRPGDAYDEPDNHDVPHATCVWDFRKKSTSISKDK